jgi:subtilisin family serine protease
MKKSVFLILNLLISLAAISQTKIENELILKFAQAIKETDLRGRSSEEESLSVLSDELHIYLFKKQEVFTEYDIIEIKKKYPSLISITYNFEVENRSTPNDPLFKDQWGLEFCNIPKVWEVTTGGKSKSKKDIVIGILDDGIDINHQDLADNIFKNKFEIPNDGIDNDNNGYVDDANGFNVDSRNGAFSAKSHGTGVTGILGAKSDNAIGISGVNWNVKILPIHGINKLDEIILANTYLLKMRRDFNTTNGARGANIVVVNYSGGIPNAFANLEPYKSWCDMYDLLGSEGILSVGSTSNSNIDVALTGDMPSTCVSEYLITTTNVGRNGQKPIDAGFSNKFIDMAAPGVGIYTLESNNAYSNNFTGTSASAPLIAGTIALLYSLPCFGLDDIAIKDRVLATQIIKDAIKQSVILTPTLKQSTKWGGYLDANGAMQRLAKYCSGEDIIPSPTGPLKIINLNYSNYKMKVEYLTPDNDTKYQILVNDISGKTILFDNLIVPKYGAKIVDLNIGYLIPGIYFVTIISPNGVANRKLFIN